MAGEQQPMYKSEIIWRIPCIFARIIRCVESISPIPLFISFSPVATADRRLRDCRCKKCIVLLTSGAPLLSSENAEKMWMQISWKFMQKLNICDNLCVLIILNSASIAECQRDDNNILIKSIPLQATWMIWLFFSGRSIFIGPFVLRLLFMFIFIVFLWGRQFWFFVIELSVFAAVRFVFKLIFTS